MKYALYAAALVLAACAAPVRTVAPACPVVPECVRPQIGIAVNADLVRAYQETAAALAQCRVYRDILAACVQNAQKE